MVQKRGEADMIDIRSGISWPRRSGPGIFAVVDAQPDPLHSLGRVVDFGYFFA